MDSSVQLTEYAGLVDAVFAKLSDALTPQLGDGPDQAATRAGNAANAVSPAERALNLRFALGGDTVTYLNNGVALLAAGTAKDAIDVSGLAGGHVLAGAKSAVYNELRRREKLDLQNAPKALEDVRSLVVWLLCIPEVAGAFRFFLDENDNSYREYKSTTNVEGLYEQLERIAAQIDPGDAVGLVNSTIQQTGFAELRQAIRTLLLFLNPFEGPLCVVHNLLERIEGGTAASSTVTKWGAFQKDVEQRAKADRLRQSIEPAPTNGDLEVRYAMLQQEMATAAGQGDTGDDATAWFNRCWEGATEIDEDGILAWVQMAGLVGEIGPGEKRSPNDPFSYNMSLFKNLSLPRYKVDSSLLESIDSEKVQAFEDFGNVLGVCLIGCNVIEEDVALTMPVRWMPQGPLARDQCRAAVLEHVIMNMRYMRLKGLGEAKYVAASAKLLQLEHLQRIRAEDSEIAKGRHNVPKLVTPNAQYNPNLPSRLRLGVPFLRPEVNYQPQLDDSRRLRRNEVIGVMHESNAELVKAFEAAQEEAERHNETKRERNYWPHARVIPSSEDIAVSMRPVEISNEAVVSSKRQATGKRTPVKAELLSADSLKGCELSLEQPPRTPHPLRRSVRVARYLCNGVRLCDLLEKGASMDAPPLASPIPSSGPEATRATLWREMLREISISSDRLWVFVKLLSGAMGESAETLLTVADEAAQKAQRAFEAARKDIAERSAAFHVKLVEIVVGGILRGSKLEAIPDHAYENEAFPAGLFVADAEMAKEIRALASGESGRPFFEANVAIQGVLRAKNGKKVAMADLIASLGPIVEQLNSSMQAELSNASGGALGLAALSAPRNSYMVSLRDDVVAALRIAHDRLCNELGSRHISLWELVEGASGTLSLRFAEFVAQVLVATRVSSGTAALYVSHHMITTNVHQARAALGRLVKECHGYMSTFRSPDFGAETGRGDYFTASQGKTVPLASATPATPARVLVSSDASGWHRWPR